MKKYFLFVLVLLTFSNCQKSNDANKLDAKSSDARVDSTKPKPAFEMYEMAEMALFMEQMYAYNQQLRTRIIAQDSLGVMPDFFENIHTAEMTDTSDKDPFFEAQATLFLTAQRAIYEDPAQAKDMFNAMVTSCLECHAKKCGGPIPRIKKLFIP